MTDTNTVTLPSDDFVSLVRTIVRIERQLTQTEADNVNAASTIAEAREPSPDLEAFVKLLHCEKHEVLDRIERLAETENDRKRIYYLSSLLAGDVTMYIRPDGGTIRSKGVPWLRAQLERLFAGKDSVADIAADIEKHEEDTRQIGEKLIQQRNEYEARKNAIANEYRELSEVLGYAGLGQHGAVLQHTHNLLRDLLREKKDASDLASRSATATAILDKGYRELLDALGFAFERHSATEVLAGAKQMREAERKYQELVEALNPIDKDHATVLKTAKERS